jgi:hypothetical protein
LAASFISAGGKETAPAGGRLRRLAWGSAPAESAPDYFKVCRRHSFPVDWLNPGLSPTTVTGTVPSTLPERLDATYANSASPVRIHQPDGVFFCGPSSTRRGVPGCLRGQNTPSVVVDSVKFTSELTVQSFWRSSVLHTEPLRMEYKGVEYSVVRLTDDTGWRWEVRFDDGKHKSGVTPVSRAFAIKLAEYEIDRVVKDRK